MVTIILAPASKSIEQGTREEGDDASKIGNFTESHTLSNFQQNEQTKQTIAKETIDSLKPKNFKSKSTAVMYQGDWLGIRNPPLQSLKALFFKFLHPIPRHRLPNLFRHTCSPSHPLSVLLNLHPFPLNIPRHIIFTHIRHPLFQERDHISLSM